MQNSAHDREHVNRVLYLALDIASHENNVNDNILVAACLLHDIGREEQYQNASVCHAEVGSEKALTFIRSLGWSEDDAEHIRSCILTHRYRKAKLPVTIEAKILFDADKLDGIGAIGIARTLMYIGKISKPLYSLDSSGNILDGSIDPTPSFFQEYKFKIEHLFSSFYTKRAAEIAYQRQTITEAFYSNMLNEVSLTQKTGLELLRNLIN